MLINVKRHIFDEHRCSNKCNKVYNKFKCLQNKLSSLIEGSKEKYYNHLSSKLNAEIISPKVIWSIIKYVLNNKKIPCILPLFHENKVIVDYKKKAKFLIHFLRDNIPILKIKVTQEILIKTQKHLSDASFTIDSIAKIINNLDPEKAHGHDMISMWMLKLCRNSIFKSSRMDF